MNLSGDAYSVLVDVPSGQLGSMDRVEPGDPANSYLWNKLNDSHASVGGTGNSMPPSGLLDADTLATIETWINEGANP